MLGKGWNIADEAIFVFLGYHVGECFSNGGQLDRGDEGSQ